MSKKEYFDIPVEERVKNMLEKQPEIAEDLEKLHGISKEQLKKTLTKCMEDSDEHLRRIMKYEKFLKRMLPELDNFE